MKNSKQTSHLKILLVMFIFLFPIIAGSVLYHFRDAFHFQHSNHGTLINPPVVVSDLWETDKKWRIVFVPAGCCDAACEKKMFMLHQLHLALGNDNRRTSLVLVVDRMCPKADAHDFKKVDLTAAQFTKIPKNKIYLVDPQSNLFMSYNIDADLKDIYNDLKHVLEVSQIG